MMKKTKFKRLKCLFPVNWKTILIGWIGPGTYERLISYEDIKDELNEEEVFCKEVESLAGAVEANDNEMIISHLTRLAAGCAGNSEDEFKKWQIVLLEDLLPKLSQDSMYGLIELTEFWERFDFPEYAPHLIQGKGNSLTPDAYYTDETYQLIKEKHLEWMNVELQNLSCRE